MARLGGAELAMTVGDLRKIIKGLPDATPLIEQRYSDYGPVAEGTIHRGRGVMVEKDPKGWYRAGAWDVDADIPADIDPARVIEVLIYEGN